MATLRGTGQLTLMDMNDIVASVTAPLNPMEGSLWFNTTEGQLYVYTSGKWLLSNKTLIGGRNLLSKTKDIEGYANRTTDLYNGLNIARSTKGATGYTDTFNGRTINIPNTSTVHTVSFYAKASANVSIVCHWYSPNSTKTSLSSTGHKGTNADGLSYVDITTTWQRYWVTWTQDPATTTATKSLIVGRNNGLPEGTVVEIAGVKLEEGNIPTDWSPAPEDIDGAITDITETLGNMANDNVIEYNERKVIKDKLTGIIGYVLADTATSLPTASVLDLGTSGRGSFYYARKSALMAGLTTSTPEYVALATAWDNATTGLKQYLDGLPTVKPWDVSSANSKKTSAVTKATFRDRWKTYYSAELALDNATAKKLKDNVDDVVVGGTNYASNGDFAYELDTAMWSASYVGQTKQIVDISSQKPPFKYALNVKNTSNANGGIFTPTLFAGANAESLVNKEITVSFWLKYSGITQGTNTWNLGRFGELLIEGVASDNVTKTTRYVRASATNADSTDTTATDSVFISGTDTTWKKYVITTKLSLPANTVKLSNIYFKHGLEGCVGEFWTTGIKVEIGNKVTDWSECPYDVRDRITKVQMEITGESIINKIKTQPAWGEKANASDIAELDSMQLLHKTRFDSTYSTDSTTKKWAFNSPWTIDNTKFFKGFGTAKIDISGKTADAWVGLQSELVPAVEGETFTASVYTSTDSLTTDVENRGWIMEVEYFNGASRITTSSLSIKPSTVNTWERFSKTVVTPVNTTGVRVRFHPTRNGRFWVAKPMLSRSPVLTAFSEHVDELSTELSSQISQTSSKISLVVGADNKIKGDSIASAISLTPTAIDLISQNINLTGKVTYASLGTDMVASFDTDGKVKATRLSGQVADANLASASTWNTATTNVNNVLSDLKITPPEKSTLKNEWERIKKEYAQKILQAGIVGADYQLLKTAYDKFNNETPRLDSEVFVTMSATYSLTTATRDSLKAKFVEYYNQVATLSKVITDNTTDIGQSMMGKMLYDDPEFTDGLNGVNVYNNTANSTDVQIKRVASATDAPAYVVGKNMVEIRHVGSASNPSMGGFTFFTQSKANAVFYVRFVAKIPANYVLNFASNATGTGGSTKWLSSNIGTGKWEEYLYKITCGSTGTFSTTAFFYLSAPSGVTPTYPFVWNLDTATVYEYNAKDYTARNSAKFIGDMSSDGKITPPEKINLRKEYGAITAEYSTYISMAQSYNILPNSTPYTNYVNGYNAVVSMITPLIDDMLKTSDAPALLRSTFENYYKRRAELSKAIDDKGRYNLDQVNSAGNMTTNAVFNDWTSSLPAGMTIWAGASYVSKETSITRDGDFSLRFKGMGVNNCGVFMGGMYKPDIANPKYVVVEIAFNLLSGSLQGAGILVDWAGMSTSGAGNRARVALNDTFEGNVVYNKWYSVKKILKRPTDVLTGYTGMQGYLMTNYSEFGAGADSDLIVSKILVREASEAEVKSYEATVAIDDMSSDSKISSVEKNKLKTEWEAIKKQKDSLIKTVSNAGMTYNNTKLAYESAFNNLSNKVTPVLSNMTTTSTIDSSFRTAFIDYYDKEAILLDTYNQQAYLAKKIVDSWGTIDGATGQTIIDGGKIKTDELIAKRVRTDYQDTNTEILGGRIASTGTFSRTFDGSNTAEYMSTFDSYNGALRVGISSKKVNGVEKISSGGRSITYSDKAITTQRAIHANSGNRNGARFIDFFADETLNSDVQGLGMQIYSGQEILMEGAGHVSIRSTKGYIFLQPEYENVGNNSFSLQVIDGDTSAETDGIILYGSQVNGYASGIRFSKQVSDPTVYLTDGTGARGKGKLQAYEVRASYLREGGSRVVTNDRMASGREVVTGITANTPKSKYVSFGQTFSSVPDVVAVASTTVPGTTVTGVSVSDVTKTGFTVWVTRTNTTDTGIQWMAYKNEP